MANILKTTAGGYMAFCPGCCRMIYCKYDRTTMFCPYCFTPTDAVYQEAEEVVQNARNEQREDS